ncbi:MAG: NTPase [Candidatus Margulisiibacteriota bacterium]
MADNILLSGPPGCGKTTIIKDVLKQLKGIKAGGFHTSEIREGGVRKGFKITSLDGREAILSHIDFKGPFRVSKYGVSIENLESIGLRAIQDAIQYADIIVIDEIGKMELFSENIRNAILAALDSPKKVLGTIMMASNPFTDQIKKRKDVSIVEVERKEQEKALNEILEAIKIRA